MWTPATIEQIQKDIAYCRDIFFYQTNYLRFWDYIKMEPEKWKEKTMGEKGDGFWVVGIIGKSVLYYNDIEEGYNCSPYTNYGEIDEYHCGQLELYELIEGLYESIINVRADYN